MTELSKNTQVPQCDKTAVICSYCEGNGWFIDIEIEAECCGNYGLPSCCGVPIPKQVQVQKECPYCDCGNVPI